MYDRKPVYLRQDGRFGPVDGREKTENGIQETEAGRQEGIGVAENLVGGDQQNRGSGACGGDLLLMISY